MAADFAKIDPAWAWASYRPTAQNPWSRQLAAHLHRRAGFGATGAELDQAMKLGPDGAVDRLCNPPKAQPAEDITTGGMLAEHAIAAGSIDELAAAWLYRMVNGPDPLLEKLTLFWHGHFATSAAKVDKLWMMQDQNELLRAHARGKFGDMVTAISRDPAMLMYLDSTTNRRIHPNENYARELMELFTLGVGNYSEQDIKEIARAFTGWEILGDHFRFDKVQHDTHPKTFLGQSGNFDGNDAVRIVLEQPAAPRFIARKLVRFFMFDEPAAPDTLLEPIVRDLRENGFEIGPVVRRIFGSNLFFSEYSLGRKVRSPVELAVGLLHVLGATTSLVKLARGTADLGEALFRPPNVKGWDGGRMWINSSTLLGRANFVGQMLSAPETSYAKAGGNLAIAAQKANAHQPGEIVDWLLGLLVAVPVPASARQVLVQLATDSANADRSSTIAKLLHAISALPEFQLA